MVECLDTPRVEALCGEKHAHCNGDQRFQRGSADTRKDVTTAVEHEFDLYRVNDSGPVIEQGEQTVQKRETITVVPGPLWRFGGPLLLVAGLLGLAGTGYARYAGHVPLSDRERAYLAYRTDRNEFDE